MYSGLTAEQLQKYAMHKLACTLAVWGVSGRVSRERKEVIFTVREVLHHFDRFKWRRESNTLTDSFERPVHACATKSASAAHFPFARAGGVGRAGVVGPGLKLHSRSSFF